MPGRPREADRRHRGQPPGRRPAPAHHSARRHPAARLPGPPPRRPRPGASRPARSAGSDAGVRARPRPHRRGRRPVRPACHRCPEPGGTHPPHPLKQDRDRTETARHLRPSRCRPWPGPSSPSRRPTACTRVGRCPAPSRTVAAPPAIRPESPRRVPHVHHRPRHPRLGKPARIPPTEGSPISHVEHDGTGAALLRHLRHDHRTPSGRPHRAGRPGGPGSRPRSGTEVSSPQRDRRAHGHGGPARRAG